MENSKVHRIVLRPGTYDVISADTGFYAFIGKRLYCVFDKFIAEKDRDTFYKHAEAMDTERFMVEMYAEDESKVMCCLQITKAETEGQMIVLVMIIDELIEATRKLTIELRDKNRLLDLYGDYLFLYNPMTGIVEIYISASNSQRVLTCSFEDIVYKLKDRIQENNYEALDMFVASVRGGARTFELTVAGDIFGENTDIKFSQIRGASIYEGSKFCFVVGYIHQGNNTVDNGKKRIEIDPFTGLLAKSEITNAAIRAIDVEKREGITLAIIDIDYFKKVNDTFGHLVGDELLKSVASIIEREVGDSGMVGRFGGDEFFIVFFDVDDMEKCRERLRSIKNIVNSTYPSNDEGKPAVTLSIGCATYPKDANNYEDVFKLADFALYRAKEKGRNRYIIYDKEKHGTIEDIKDSKEGNARINSHGIMATGDILCMIMDKVYNSENYKIDKLLDDFAENLGFERIIVYTGQPYRATWMVGEKIPSRSVFAETEAYLTDEAFVKEYKNNTLLLNNIDMIASRAPKAYELLKKHSVLSLVQIKFKDKNGVDCIMSLEAVNKNITWNENNMHNYRLMARLLSEFELG